MARKEERTLWPEVALLLLVAACIVLLVRSCGKEPAAAVEVQVPVPAEKLIGGSGPLAPGAALKIVASVPDAKGTPQIVSLSGVRLQAIVAGAEKKETLLLATGPDAAPTLQSMLLVDKAVLSYQVLPGTPTATPSPTATPEDVPAATATPLPAQGTTYIRLGLDRIEVGSSSPVTGEASLVFVYKKTSTAGAAGTAGGATPESAPVYVTETHPVKVADLLDEKGNRQKAYDKEKSKSVLLEVALEDIAELARKLAQAEKIWLVSPPVPPTPAP